MSAVEKGAEIVGEAVAEKAVSGVMESEGQTKEQTQTAEEIGAVKDVALSTVKGALRGGTAGALAGAATGVLKNRKARNLVGRYILVGVAMVALVIGGGIFSVSNLLSGMSGQQQQGAMLAEQASGASKADTAAAVNATSGTVIPSAVYLAVKQVTGAAPDVRKLGRAMTAAGLNGSNNDPSVGMVTVPGGGLTLGSDEAAKRAQKDVAVKYKVALTAFGLSDSDASRVFTLAQQWLLGKSGCGDASGANALPAANSGESAGGASGGALNVTQTGTLKAAIGVAKSIFPDPALAKKAAIAAVVAAIVESGLENPTGGDRDSVGSWQERPSAGWGTPEQIMNQPFAVAQWYQQMLGKDGATWQSLPPGQIAADVEVSAFQERYSLPEHVNAATSYVNTLFGSAPALPVPAPLAKGAIPWGVGGSATALGATTAGPSNSGTNGQACVDAGGVAGAGDITGNDQQLAQALMAAVTAGKLTFEDDNSPVLNKDRVQIQNVAEGKAVPNCAVHTGVLQLVTLALNMFGSVQVNDLNRLCDGTYASTGVLGLGSPHAAQGGGWAVDFGRLGGEVLDGSGRNDIKFLQTINSMPTTGGKFNAGQIGCRPPLELANVHQFDDTCNHQHIDSGAGINTTFTGVTAG